MYYSHFIVYLTFKLVFFPKASEIIISFLLFSNTNDLVLVNLAIHPLGDVGVHHKVVDMFLCSGQLQLPGDHRHHQDGAAGPLQESQIDMLTVRI